MHEPAGMNTQSPSNCGCPSKPDGSCGCPSGSGEAAVAAATIQAVAPSVTASQPPSPAPAAYFVPYRNIAALQPIQVNLASPVVAARTVSNGVPVMAARLPATAIMGSFAQLASRTSMGLGATKLQFADVRLGHPFAGAATMTSQPTGLAPAIKPSGSSFSTSPRFASASPAASASPTNLSAAAQSATPTRSTGLSPRFNAVPPASSPSGSPQMASPAGPKLAGPYTAGSVPNLQASSSAAPASCCIPGTQYNCCCTGDPSNAFKSGGAPASPGGSPAGSPAAKTGAGKAAYDYDYGQWQAGYTHFPPDPNDPKYGGEAASGAAAGPAGPPSTTPRSPGSQRITDPDNPSRTGWWYPGFAPTYLAPLGGPLDVRGGFVGEWNKEGKFIGVGTPPTGGVEGTSTWIAQQF